MSNWSDHLMIAPIVLPLATAAVMLLFDERRWLQAGINVASTLILLSVAVGLLQSADESQIGVYRLGNWPAPFGIVLVVDRLSALMVLLTSFLAIATLVFSLARWHRAGAYFHPLFQCLLLGLNGAFLTGDLFNLFVFFEVMLTASYGLVLHGSGIARVKAGLHYIAVNLAASFVFLIGVSLIYGVTGTLNMADLALHIPRVAGEDRMLLEAGAAILGIAFLVKAGMWPLCFWLPSTYAVSAPPAAAMFVIMSKVGVYVVLRLSLLLFGPESGSAAPFGGGLILYGGLATVAFGMIGVLASQDMSRLAAFSVLVSSGTLLAALGFGYVSVTGSALYYLISSTLAIAAFFLLIELIERGREVGSDMLAVTMEAYGEDPEGDPEDTAEHGLAIPATIAILSTAFVLCASLLAGLPPLSGFVAKFALARNVIDPTGAASAVPVSAWLVLTLLIVSGFAALIAMARAGMRSFWPPIEREVPRVRVVEAVPVGALLLGCVVLTLQAEPVMRYMQAAAEALHYPQDYVRSVLAPPRSGSEVGQ